jgi:hypothetical protein
LVVLLNLVFDTFNDDLTNHDAFGCKTKCDLLKDFSSKSRVMNLYFRTICHQFRVEGVGFQVKANGFDDKLQSGFRPLLALTVYQWGMPDCSRIGSCRRCQDSSVIPIHPSNPIAAQLHRNDICTSVPLSISNSMTLSYDLPKKSTRSLRNSGLCDSSDAVKRKERNGPQRARSLA